MCLTINSLKLSRGPGDKGGAYPKLDAVNCDLTRQAPRKSLISFSGGHPIWDRAAHFTEITFCVSIGYALGGVARASASLEWNPCLNFNSINAPDQGHVESVQTPTANPQRRGTVDKGSCSSDSVWALVTGR